MTCCWEFYKEICKLHVILWGGKNHNYMSKYDIQRYNFIYDIIKYAYYIV